jgi:AmmeMemoRadiSam system protein B
MLGEFVKPSAAPIKAIGVVSPHAGYVYSGRVAGAVFSRVLVTDTVLILTPAHRQATAPFGLWTEGEWITPLGSVPTDEALSKRLLNEVSDLREDYIAHVSEHSGEVQVPFLQRLSPNVKIVAIVVATQSLPMLKRFGSDLAAVLKAVTPRPLIVASSDMTHYEPEEAARRKDKLAIDEILALDPDGLWTKVVSTPISMCGMAPTVSMLVCAKVLGATSAELVLYETSSRASGDSSSVVGYAGMVVR